mmetsp:Transcript_3697/g.8022  ORF Transcript_3697/g.8022 Transcript_3697/m.8022 type:complete len:346 (-) Transcript_3697:61-1098(-)
MIPERRSIIHRGSAPLATITLVGFLLRVGGLLAALTEGVLRNVDAACAFSDDDGERENHYLNGGPDEEFFAPSDEEIEAYEKLKRANEPSASPQRAWDEPDENGQIEFEARMFKELEQYKNLVEKEKSQGNPTYTYVDPMHRTTPPKLCADGQTYGYSDLNSLRNAIKEANKNADESFVALSEYFAAFENYEDNRKENKEPIPPEVLLPDPFIICPGITLKSRRTTTLEINAEEATILCDGCTIQAPGTHIAFGPNARNVLIRGVTFTGATTSSLTFHQHGASVDFEDCFWDDNSGVSNAVGAIADLNSTSSVSFYRCEISDKKQTTRVAGGQVQQASSSLTIRN